MRSKGRTISSLALAALAWTSVSARAELLTADRAVQIALQHSNQVINAHAAVLDAKAGLYSAYSLMLPRVSASIDRSGSWTDHRVGNQAFGSLITAPQNTYDINSYSTTPQLTGSWSVLDLSAISGRSAAGSGVRAAELRHSASKNEVALAVRRQFYQVVQAIQLVQVNNEALRLAHDDEKRVRALFEVGSVSRSDVLQAQVRTAQSQLDSLTSDEAVTTQRLALANLIGVVEREMGDVDTVLTAEVHDYDESALVNEAARTRPDLQAAEASLRQARQSLRSARFARLPYITVGGSAGFRLRTATSFQIRDTNGVALPVPFDQHANSKTDRVLSANVALNWDLFTGLATESRISSARAGVLRAEDARDVLKRNLEGEVHAALLSYREAVQRTDVSTHAIEAAAENVKLTQQKYNVGSATILDLINAQVNLQRARSDAVAALAGMRVAEAQIERVRGH